MIARLRATHAWLLAVLVLAGLHPPRVAMAAGSPPADSIRIESAPAPLIKTPPRTTTREPAPSDTAVANVRARARESFGRGLMLEEQQAFAAAIVAYTNAARADPTLHGPSFRIGRLYASRRQWDPAARAFREEMRRAPDDRAAAREYSLMLFELGDTTRAVRMLQDLTRRSPSDPTLWRALGFVHGRLEYLAEAEKELRGAVALNARYALAWRDLGVVLAARGKPREAREAYRRSIAADPADEGAVVNLANLESEQGDHTRALALYRDAERIDTTQALAYRGQIRELVSLGHEGDAGAVWRRWLSRTPYDLVVREGTARHFVRQRRSDVSLAVAREGVRLDPKQGGAWELLGEMHAVAGDTLAALGAYRDARRRFKDPVDLARADASIAALRAVASDSLRGHFAADSVDHAMSDTTRAPGN